MAKDAKQTPQNTELHKANDQPVNFSARGVSSGPNQQAPIVLPSTVINLAVHSLLMITVPFVLFFATAYGALDPLLTATGASIPRQEVKYYVGAGLAVLGVNLVICSFVIAAFREKVPEAKKTQ